MMNYKKGVSIRKEGNIKMKRAISEDVSVWRKGLRYSLSMMM